MEFNCKEQLGGIAKLDFYLLSETSNWPLVVTDVTSAQIVFTPEDVEVDATIDEDSIRPIISQKNNADGSLWTPNIKLSFISRSEALEQLLDQYQNKPGVVVISLNTGIKKLIGTNLEPLYMNYEVNEGTKIDDANASTELDIKGELRQRPVYIDC